MKRKRLPDIQDCFHDYAMETMEENMENVDPRLTGEVDVGYIPCQAPSIDELLPFSRKELEQKCSIEVCTWGHVHDTGLRISWFIPNNGIRTGWENIQGEIKRAWNALADCYVAAWGENGYMR